MLNSRSSAGTRGRGALLALLLLGAACSVPRAGTAAGRADAFLVRGGVARGVVQVGGGRRLGVAPRRVAQQDAGTDVFIRKTDTADEEDYDEEVCLIELTEDGEDVRCKPIKYDGKELQNDAVDQRNSVALVRRREFPRLREFLDRYGEMNPYKVLGVKLFASREQVREAYLQICKTEHPDLNGGHESMRFQVASKAYRILHDERGKYSVRQGVRAVADLTAGFFSFAMAVAAAGAKAVNKAEKEADKVSERTA